MSRIAVSVGTDFEFGPNWFPLFVVFLCFFVCVSALLGRFAKKGQVSNTAVSSRGCLRLIANETEGRKVETTEMDAINRHTRCQFRTGQLELLSYAFFLDPGFVCVKEGQKEGQQERQKTKEDDTAPGVDLCSYLFYILYSGNY